MTRNMQKSIKEVPKFQKVANKCNITWELLSSYIISLVSVCPVVVVVVLLLGGKGVRVSMLFIMNIFGLMI
jgi:hypothetical protein